MKFEPKDFIPKHLDLKDKFWDKKVSIVHAAELANEKVAQWMKGKKIVDDVSPDDPLGSKGAYP